MSTMELTRAELQTILRSDFSTFIERAFYELNPQARFFPGAYIELLAAKLDQVRRGECKRLIINLPPRTPKSHAASVAFPAWLLGHEPSKQILCASYGQDLADKHARDCRTLVSSQFYRSLFPRTALSPEKKAVEDFMTTNQGFRLSVCVGGPITGRGADIIIVDDPLKPEDALSEAQRRKTNDWYFNTLLSRLNSKADGAIVLVMQRLHQQDLVGEVMDRESWEVLALPAIAQKDELYEIETVFGQCRYARKVGEALHRERDTVEIYQNIREAIGEYNFQSQYQQNPASREGGVVKSEWIRFYEGLTSRGMIYVLQSWDTANRGGDCNDYSVCTTWGTLDGDFYLLDVFRKRLNFPDLKRSILDLFRRYNPQKLLIEDKGSGSSMLQELKSEFIWCLEAYNPKQGDKLTRLAAQSIKFESGRVYLAKQAPWLDEYVHEITGFPGAKHDDQVDSTSQALDALTNYSYPPPKVTGIWRPWAARSYETC